MIRFGKLLPLLPAVCLAFAVAAAGAPDNNPRPKIGLALSGGGAKGLAHIGVLKVLEEAGIGIDYIAGTSMGSIVGALYSIGYDPASLERIVLEQDWQAVMTDETTRRNLSMEEKLEDSRYTLSLPVRDWGIRLPSGLVSGQKVTMMLTGLTLPVHHVDDFSVLPIPFRAIATDLETGEPVVLDKGFLADALRASMSIPTIFRPVQIDGRLLVDGYLVRNLPVSDVREMGADYVIGVDVGAPLYKKEELGSLIKVMDQVTSFRSAEDTRRQHELCDLLIQPDLDDYGSLDFSRADSLIAAGERAARVVLPQLRALADSLGTGQAAEGLEYSHSPIRQFYVTELRTEGLHNVSKELLLGKLQLKVPSRLTVKQVEQAVERAWGSRFFERVSYRIEPAGETGTALVIRVVEQDNDYLRLGVHYDNDLKSAVLVNLMYRNIGIEGSKLSISANLSENESYSTQYLIFTNWQPGLLLGFSSAYNNLNLILFDEAGQVQANLDFSLYIAEMTVATIFSNVFVLGVTGQYRRTVIKNIFAPPDWQSGSYGLTSAIGFATLDTWDRTIYPHRGFYLNLNSQLVTDFLGTDFKGQVPYGYAIPSIFGVHTVSLQGAVQLSDNFSALYTFYGGAATHSRIPDDYKFYLGGQYLAVDQGFPFMGLKFLERVGTHAYVLQAGLQYEFRPGQVVQFRANVGKAADSASAMFESEGTDAGAGITLGWHSPIGPLEYSLSYGNRRRELLSYVNVGYRF